MQRSAIRRACVAATSLVAGLALAATAVPAQASAIDAGGVRVSSQEPAPATDYTHNVIGESYAGPDGLELNRELLRRTAIAVPRQNAPKDALPSGVGTQCIVPRNNMNYYGMTFQECQNAVGTEFNLYNTDTVAHVASIEVPKVPYSPNTISLGCWVSGGGLVLSLPGLPTQLVGWTLKGGSVLLAVVGVSVSCPN